MECLIKAIQIDNNQPPVPGRNEKENGSKLQTAPSVTSIMTTQSIPEPWHYKANTPYSEYMPTAGGSANSKQHCTQQKLRSTVLHKGISPSTISNQEYQRIGNTRTTKNVSSLKSSVQKEYSMS